MAKNQIKQTIRIGITISLSSITLTTWYFVQFLFNTPSFFRESIKLILFFTIIISSIALIMISAISYKRKKYYQFLKIYQFLFVFLVGIVLVSQNINTTIGYPLILFSIILLLRYKLLTGFRFILILLFTVITIELTQYIRYGILFESISFTIFTILFFIMIYMVFQEDLIKAEQREKELSMENSKLKQENRTLNTHLSDLKPVAKSLDSIGLTGTERRVLSLLCKTKGTNLEIAKTMNLKEITIKVHISNILKKSELKKRWDLINCFSSDIN